MFQSVNSASNKTGMPPGVLIHVGELLESHSRISVITYNEKFMQESLIYSVKELIEICQDNKLTWVLIEGLNNIEFIQQLGDEFNIHDLVLEDILNTHQRPKLEQHDNYLYIVLKSLTLKDDVFEVEYEQVSFLLFKNIIFVFKEKQDKTFDCIKNHLKKSKPRFKELGSDYLVYTMIDTVVDFYFSLNDYIDEHIEAIEEDLLNNPTQESLIIIQKTKRELIFLKKSITPLRDLLIKLLRNECVLIQESNYIYFRDVLDHVMRVIESIDNYKEVTTSLLDIYLSSVSYKMNEIMKVLTLFASIFIPLTFLVGIYGMNFDYMPELKWKWSYFILWGVFIIIPIISITYFKKKKWL